MRPMGYNSHAALPSAMYRSFTRARRKTRAGPYFSGWRHRGRRSGWLGKVGLIQQGGQKMLRIILAVFAITIATEARCAIGLGPGNLSCGTWLQERRAGGWPTLNTQTWVLGFMSAYNFYASEDGNVSSGTDVAGLMAWIDQYCSSHPLDNVDKAAKELITVMEKNRR
jgi:hypothetical protein